MTDNDLTISETKKRLNDLERDIQDLVNKFSKDTGTMVKDIGLESVFVSGHDSKPVDTLVVVSVTVEL